MIVANLSLICRQSIQNRRFRTSCFFLLREPKTACCLHLPFVANCTSFLRTYQSSKYTKTTAESDPVVVTVEPPVEMKQTTRKEFVIDFGKVVADITSADVKVIEKTSLLNGAGVNDTEFFVNKVTMATDKKSATVELFYEFNDGGIYEVTVKGYDKETIVASKGAPKRTVLFVDNNINNRNVCVDTTTAIQYKVYDAKGIDVTTGNEMMNYTITYANGIVEYGNTLYFANIGETAKVTAEYHSNNYGNDGVETGVYTSDAFTFVSVAKTQNKITGIKKYTTESWWPAVDSIKLEEDLVYTAGAATPYAPAMKNLKVYITLTETKSWEDGILLEKYGQEICDKNGVLLGTANFTSLNTDILDVKRNELDGTVGLYARKAGTAPVMVSYINTVNGYDQEVAIGTVLVKVLDRSKLSKVELSAPVLTISTEPSDDATSVGNITDNRSGDLFSEIAVVDPIVNVTVKDQYDRKFSDLSLYNKKYTLVKVEGKDLVSKRVDTVALNAGDKTEYTGAIDISNNKIEIDTAVFKTMLDDIQRENINRVVYNQTFSFNVTVQDVSDDVLRDGLYITKTVSFTLNARKPIVKTVNNVPVVDRGVSVDVMTRALGWNGNNAARTWSNGSDAWVKGSEKSICFTLYEISNSAKWNEETIVKHPGTRTATAGYYYRVYKNGVDITNAVYTDATGSVRNVVDSVPLNAATNAALFAKLNLSGNRKSTFDTNRTIVTYSTAQGAGNYKFVLYQTDDNGVIKEVSNSSKAVSVAWNQGSYKTVSRNTMTAASDNGLDLLKCFTFQDRNGNNVQEFRELASGQLQAKFDNVWRDCTVVTKPELNGANTVYVDKVVFWENVNVDGTPIDVEYATPVGYSVYVPYWN